MGQEQYTHARKRACHLRVSLTGSTRNRRRVLRVDVREIVSVARTVSTVSYTRSVPASHTVEETHLTPLPREGWRQKEARGSCLLRETVVRTRLL
jgi:hypothetical protein